MAVIDDGYEMTHEDIDPSIFIASYDAAGSFMNPFPVPDAYPQWECRFGGSVWCWHGTAVLGMAASTSNNFTGVAGVEDNSHIMPIKFTDFDGNSNETVVIDALEYAGRRHGGISANAISISWSVPFSPSIELKLKDIHDRGKPIICATNNYGEVYYPASSPYVLAVGMTDRYDVRDTRSGAGPTLDVLAPGVDLWTLDLSGNFGLVPNIISCPNVNYACGLVGTSFAAPEVAAIVEKIFRVQPEILGPPQAGQPASKMYDIIRYSSERSMYGVMDTSRVDDFHGWGRVNATRALLAVTRGDADNSGSVNITDAVYIINYIFAGGPAPVPHNLTGDADGNGIVTISDAVYVIDYIWGGPPPPISFSY